LISATLKPTKSGCREETQAPTASATPQRKIMLPTESLLSIAVISLGLFHGINPTSGWLLGVYRGLMARSGVELIVSITLIAIGHGLAAVAALILAAAVTPLGAAATPLAAASAISISCYKLVKTNHKYLGLKIGKVELITIGFLLGFLHGSTSSLLPFLTIRCSLSPSFSSALMDSAFILSLHSITALCSMLVLGLVVYYILGIHVLKKIWVNYDKVWNITIITTIFYLLTQQWI